MNRRNFMLGSLALGCAQLPCALASKTKEWRYQFQSIKSETLEPMTLKTVGKWPASLKGNLFRNGPALFERNQTRYEHWFDGDGMINQFQLEGNRITHQARFVATKKYQKEQAAERFLYSATGTHIKSDTKARNNDDINTANTHVIPFNDELLALWEGGSAYRIDAKTLKTIGPMTWNDELQHIPFSAHPHRDKQGDLWNYGFIPYMQQPLLMIYHIGADNQLKRYKTIKLNHPGYMHDFMVTDDYLLFLNSSCLFNKKNAKNYIAGYQWQENQASEVILVDKHSLKVIAIIDIPPQFVFHFSHAQQLNKNAIVFYAAAYNDAEIMLSSMRNAGGVDPQKDNASLKKFYVDLSSKKIKIENTQVGLEFPQWNSALNTIFSVGYDKNISHGMSTKIVAYNVKTENAESYDYGQSTITEEPLSILHQNKHYLLHSFYNYKKNISGLALLDAKKISDGPIAMAEMNRVIPLGFHGSFVV
ncbi:MAG: carotenoid oxygenase family protein [Pseudomonadota bacterium]